MHWTQTPKGRKKMAELQKLRWKKTQGKVVPKVASKSSKSPDKELVRGWTIDGARLHLERLEQERKAVRLFIKHARR